MRNDPYAQTLGIQLTKLEADFAEAMLDEQNHMINAYGTGHGAVIYALAAMHFLQPVTRTSLGLSTTIQFIESAKPCDKIVARTTEFNETIVQDSTELTFNMGKI
ncbi:PaaI family thioesterase [Lentibacillus halodurans]|uniref:PaaI family thioesterase n=1 Tax=Lentibacillus halodurans TaxID=237679 RepID=UPI001FCD2350|nr:PaaI family thioesterase [Lentibacillus halodurans]